MNWPAPKIASPSNAAATTKPFRTTTPTFPCSPTALSPAWRASLATMPTSKPTKAHAKSPKSISTSTGQQRHLHQPKPQPRLTRSSASFTGTCHSAGIRRECPKNPNGKSFDSDCRLRLVPQKFAQQHMKMVHAILPLHRIPPAIIQRRLQPPLHRLTEPDCLLRALLHRLGLRVAEKPLKNRQGLVVRKRHDRIGLNIVGVNVQHQIRKNPKVQRLGQARARLVHALMHISWSHLLHRPQLLRVIPERLGAVSWIINLFHQPRMHDRNVVALKIIVDVHLPVAVHIIFAPLR